MAKKGKVKSNGQMSNVVQNKASLLSDEQFETVDSIDYDEISTLKSDGIDHEKCEAFRRIASAEEIEEMSRIRGNILPYIIY